MKHVEDQREADIWYLNAYQQFDCEAIQAEQCIISWGLWWNKNDVGQTMIHYIHTLKDR